MASETALISTIPNDILAGEVGTRELLSEQLISRDAKEQANQVDEQDGKTNGLWLFGSSKERIEDGERREATEEEILAETKNSPAAMVKVLGAGADLLRFNANGRYGEANITALYQQEGKPSTEIAEEVNQAVNELRQKMRDDIDAGIFTVDDAGQVFENGQALPPESIGFELNALLIESISNKVSALTALGSSIAAVDNFVQEEIGDGEDFEIIKVLYERNLIQSRREFQGGTAIAGDGGKWNESHRVNSGPTFDNIQYHNKWKKVESFESPFDKFVSDNFTEHAESSVPGLGKTFLDDLEAEYKELLAGSNLATPAWTTHEVNGDIETVGVIAGEDLSPPLTRLPTDGRYEAYRAIDQTQLTNRESITATALSQAKENVNSRVSTLSSLSEQLGANFKVDNSRFNSIIEAMNNYNKSVVDSLRRLAVSN